MFQQFFIFFAAASLLIAAQPATQAETPEEVQQRLELYRQRDAVMPQHRWKCYGYEELDFLGWRRQKDGTWLTSAKDASGVIPCVGGEPPGLHPTSAQLIAVSCNSLMIKRRHDWGWGTWDRPKRHSPDEQLVIDRCTSTTRLYQP